MPEMYAALIRHGDYQQLPKVPSAYQPFGLNEKGRKQALSAASELIELAADNACQLVDEIDCSVLQRAWQTASIIQENGSMFEKVTTFEALCERCVGSVANLTVSQIEKILAEDPRYNTPPPGWKSQSDYCLPFPGAESLITAGQRVADHLKKRMQQLAERENKNLIKVFVGHGAAFRHAAYHLGALDFESIASLSMYHGKPVLLKYQADQNWLHCGGNWKKRKAEALD